MDRYYTQYDVTIRDSIVATLSLWNSNEVYMRQEHDFLFLQFLLIDVFGGDALAEDALNEMKLHFVKELFEFRVGSDTNRTSQFEHIVDTIKKQFNDKKRST